MIRSFNERVQIRSPGANLMPLVGCLLVTDVCQPLAPISKHLCFAFAQKTSRVEILAT